jgi:hypothetical protein
MDALADLEVLADPEPRMVAIRGETLAILPLKMRQTAAFSKAVDPCLTAIITGEWQAALEDHSDALARALAVAVGRTEEWALELYPDDFITLADAVLEVNLDFFARLVLPRAADLGMKLGAMMRPAGVTPSPSLSNVDTTQRPS